MSLAPAENIGGGEFLDLKTMILAQGNRPLLAVVKILSYSPHGVPAQGTGWTGTNYPVKGDLLICSGPTTGEAEFGKEFIHGSITKTLRGVPNPKDGQPLSPPKYPIGHELGVVFEVKNPTAPNAFVVANAPDAAQFAEIGRVHAGGQGWANAQAAAARAASVQQLAAQIPDPAQAAQWQAQNMPRSLAEQQALAASLTPPAPPAAPAVPGLPPGVTPEMLAAFAAQQAAAQAPAAPAVGGAVSDAPWNTAAPVG